MRISMHLAAMLVAFTFAAAPAFAQPLPERTTALYQPFLQWELEHKDVKGNPFDVVATATFTHEATGETRKTGMFYAGENTWAFRFTATRTGTWTFETEGPGELGGRSGSVTVSANPDTAARGFIQASDGRFARQGPGEGELDAFIPNVWMNYRRWGHPDQAGWTDIASAFGDTATVAAYLDDAAAHGCNGIHALITNSWFEMDVPDARRHDSRSPDPATFAALERAILQANARGMFVHIWAWGDEMRGWTPIQAGGINGEADRRLQRYIAARLGPLPGWTMQYGFDLNEWVQPGQVVEWAEYLDQHMGWPHLLGAREAGRFTSPRSLPYLAHDARPALDGEGFYQTARELLEYAGGRPVLLERRFSWMRDGVWDDATTRRAMWQFAMAGGIGAIWGHYPPGSSPDQSGHYDAAPMRTHRDFWRRRFSLALQVDPTLSETAHALRDGRERYVLYQDATDAIEIDLSQMTSRQPAVAIDTAAPYRAIDLGTLEPGQHTLDLDHESDWAIAIGDFK